MTSTERVWMTREAHTRLQRELAALRSRPSIEVPDDLMDYDDNLVAARQARIRQIQDLLTNAIVGEDPPDDGVAEPGMVLTVRYDDTGEIETFLLGVRGAEDAGIDVYSMQSPLGSAIAGARPGEQRSYSIPSGANLPVTLLKAVPYGMHAPKPARPQSVSPRPTGAPRLPEQTATGQPSAHQPARVAPPPHPKGSWERWTTRCGPTKVGGA
jgi:transcription elongation factor GreA